MFLLDTIEIDEVIPYVKFACDIEQCNGACCTLKGGKGAPLFDSEIFEIERAYPVIESLLPIDHRTTIERYGLYEGTPGNFTTMCVNDQDCVFVYHDGPVAKCAFERAYLNGQIQWRKPLSCHLFPIRVDRGTFTRLRYEWIGECEPARVKGERESFYLSTFLRESLIRLYGKQWYEYFEKFCDDCRSSMTSEYTP
ncbi:MAG: DUF3109 family protein [Bacteroidetes bacterium]|nr:DUF3109 family protein [Bacteroidota bacterium]